MIRNKIALRRNDLHFGPYRHQAGEETTMRVLETLTGSILSAATIVLAVGAFFAL